MGTKKELNTNQENQHPAGGGKGAKSLNTNKMRISDELFQQVLIQEINKKSSKAHLKTNFFELLRTKGYSIHKLRAFDLHARYYNEYLQAQNDKLQEIATESTKEAIKWAIKSKDEYAKELADQVDGLKDQIDELSKITLGKAFKIGNKQVIVTPEDVISANNSIKSLRGEIRATIKQLGDWYGYNAPTVSKVEVTDTIDYNKLSDKALMELYNAAKAEA